MRWPAIIAKLSRVGIRLIICFRRDANRLVTGSNENGKNELFASDTLVLLLPVLAAVALDCVENGGLEVKVVVVIAVPRRST